MFRRKIIRIFLLTLFLLPLFIGGFFVGQIPQAKSVIIIPNNMLEGTVTDAETGELLEGAYVRLWDKNDIVIDECPPDLPPEYYCEVGQPFGYQVYTDSNGYYLFDEIYPYAPPDLELYVELSGYETQVIPDVQLTAIFPEATVLDVALDPQTPEPVILIPGIMASWRDFDGELKIDPFLKTYENLLDALRLTNYEDDVTLFQFPYEWRQSNTTTAEQLKDFIDHVKDKTQKPKVDLIGHSMGGIVSRAYIQSDYYENDVDQLIFLGTPQIGSVNAYTAWERGDIGKSFENYIMEQVFTIEAKIEGFDNLFDYVRNRVISVKQLLPIFDYIRDKGEINLRNYPVGYPVNEFLEDLNLSENVNKLKSRVDITNIVSNLGPGSTINILRVVPYIGTDSKWEHGYPEAYDLPIGDHGLEYGPGDETVPFQSATALESVPYTLCQSVHRPMPTNCQKLVVQALTGKVPTEFINKDRFQGLKYIKHFIIIWLFSPVDFNIEDSQGNVVGQDLATGDEINQIQGAFVGTVGNKKVVFIPNPDNGEHRINLKGTGDGDYELNVVKGDEQGSQETVVTGTINAGQEKTYLTTYDELSDEPLVIEEEQEEVTFQSVREQVNEFYKQGLITKKCIKKSLIRTLNWLERKYNQLDKCEQTSRCSKCKKKCENKKWCKKNIWKKFIILRLKILKKQVKWWHRRGYVKEPANNTLINNFDSLIQMIKDLN